MMRSRNSGRFAGNGDTKTESLTYPRSMQMLPVPAFRLPRALSDACSNPVAAVTIRYFLVRMLTQNLSLMLAGSEFQSLGRAIVKEDEYEESKSENTEFRTHVYDVFSQNVFGNKLPRSVPVTQDYPFIFYIH
ncbi:hypothetical protein ANN_23366 [Periplaneta americana]|uniref:Uncharacterized protein n=1 Tax=Periplaneta americana TaxID=6978 RepID=A0ABQ8SM29_PERAM|nr:hypothetical protein ANN_23366 [Periplaneta americana]